MELVVEDRFLVYFFSVYIIDVFVDVFINFLALDIYLFKPVAVYIYIIALRFEIIGKIVGKISL